MTNNLTNKFENIANKKDRLERKICLSRIDKIS